MALTQLEQYGATYGLSTANYDRLVSGFDGLREYEGWSEFCIPEDIWGRITWDDRDEIITYLSEYLYQNRDSTYWTTYNHNVDQVFAFYYAMCLYNRFWMKGENYLKTDSLSSVGMVFKYDYNVPSANVYVASGYLYIYMPWATELTNINLHNCEFYFNAVSDIYSGVSLSLDAYYLVEFMTDTNDAGYNYFNDVEMVDVEDLIALPDVGETATWEILYYIPPIPNIPELSTGYRLSDGSPVISGSMSYENYGVANGSLELFTEPTVGTELTVLNNSDENVFTGMVSKTTYDLYTQHYSVTLADPVTAKSNSGSVTYTGGNIITVLTSIIEDAGATLSTTLTSDAVIYSDGEETDACKLFKSLCYALGASLRYNADGTYTLTDVSVPTAITNSTILNTGGANIEILTDRYANSVTATIDTEYTEDVGTGDDDIVETEDAAGYRITITRRGEQITSIRTDDDVTGEERTELMTYDTNGYLTCRRIDSQIEGVEKIDREENYTVTDDDNYTFDIEENTYQWLVVCDFFGPGQTCDYTWVRTKQQTWEGEVHLGSISTVEEITKEVESYDAPTPTLANKQKLEYLIYQSDGPIEERVVCKEYKWGAVQISTSWPTYYNDQWILQTPTVDSSNPIVDLELSPAIYARSYHLSATATDDDAITALGEKTYEVTLVGISDVDTLQTCANNILAQRARVKQLSATVPINTAIQVGQGISYSGKIYRVENVSHDVTGFTTTLSATRVSNLAELASTINLDPTSLGYAIYKTIKAETSKSTNIARGTIVSRVGTSSYLVQVQGEKSGAYKFCKSQFLDQEQKQTGVDVLLARPTGESKQYEILGRIHETPVSASTGSSAETPATESSDLNPSIATFTAETSIGIPTLESALTWTIANASDRISGLEINYGEGSGFETINKDLRTIANTWEALGEYTVSLRLSYYDLSGELQTDTETLTIGVYNLTFLADITRATEAEDITFTWATSLTMAEGDTFVIDWKDGGENETLNLSTLTTTHAYIHESLYTPTITAIRAGYDDITQTLQNGPIAVVTAGASSDYTPPSYTWYHYDGEIDSGDSELTISLDPVHVPWIDPAVKNKIYITATLKASDTEEDIGIKVNLSPLSSPPDYEGMEWTIAKQGDGTYKAFFTTFPDSYTLAGAIVVQDHFGSYGTFGNVTVAGDEITVVYEQTEGSNGMYGFTEQPWEVGTVCLLEKIYQVVLNAGSGTGGHITVSIDSGIRD